MSDEQNKPTVDQQPTEGDSTSKVTEKPKYGPPTVANPTGKRVREDIYDRFDTDKAQELGQSSDSSSETEESKDGQDLKPEPPSPETSSETEVNPEKLPSVKKRKGKIDTAVSEKTVPLQALHESRDRFKKLNLEHRDYKTSTEQKMKELSEQVASLSAKLSTTSRSSEADLDLNEADDASNRERVLANKLRAMELKQEEFESEKKRQAAQEVQATSQKRIDKVDSELAEEGFNGFKVAGLLKTERRLLELVKAGDITDTESVDPNMWKKVYKEDVYPEIREIFVATEKAKLSGEKTNRKRAANLVDYPGAKEKVDLEDSEEDKPLSFDDFNKQQVNEIMKDKRRRLYDRNRKR